VAFRWTTKTRSKATGTAAARTLKGERSNSPSSRRQNAPANLKETGSKANKAAGAAAAGATTANKKAAKDDAKSLNARKAVKDVKAQQQQPHETLSTTTTAMLDVTNEKQQQQQQQQDVAAILMDNAGTSHSARRQHSLDEAQHQDSFGNHLAAAHIRADSSLSHQAPSIMTEVGYLPFSVEPASGRLEAGKTQQFKVKFSPLNVNDYVARLACRIANGEDGKPGLVVACKGRGLLPYCHFELPESDYISSGRRNPDLPGPSGAAPGLGLDPNTKVIEFSCVGSGTVSTRRFDIINPTNADYEYEWSNDDGQQNQHHHHQRGQFVCVTPRRGILPSGERCEAAFEFRSGSSSFSSSSSSLSSAIDDDTAVLESFWHFVLLPIKNNSKIVR
jgi:hypothetical protein